tara:strand:- start:97 stop:288 length:192 start_codon:yes stop_codon:yes gene_type:complete
MPGNFFQIIQKTISASFQPFETLLEQLHAVAKLGVKLLRAPKFLAERTNHLVATLLFLPESFR